MTKDNSDNAALNSGLDSPCDLKFVERLQRPPPCRCLHNKLRMYSWGSALMQISLNRLRHFRGEGFCYTCHTYVC